jgi:hypothetical protein
MSKFQRTYKLIYTIPPTTVNKDAEVIVVEYPLTCDFDITRNTYASANNATFRIHNLAPTTRDKIFQDRYNIFRNCFVDFYAGYGDQLSLVFTGKVMQAYSERQGTDMITEIQALDAFGIFDYSTHTFPKGTGTHDIIKTLTSDMENIKLGAVGIPNERIAGHLSIDSVSFDAISKLTGGLVFVDLGKLNVLTNKQVLQDAEIYKIDSNTGLLGTPKRRDAQVEIDMIFEPKITVGQLVEVESFTAAIFDGQFKVIGIKHSGTISGAIAGEARTTLNLFIGPLIPNSNQIFTAVAPNEPLKQVKDFKITPLGKGEIDQCLNVYNYIMANNGAIPNKILIGNIKWSNVLGNNNTNAQRMKQLSFGNVQAVYETAVKAYKLCKKIYPSATMIVSSGWRSKENNANVGGVSKSLHLLGYAIDFKLNGGGITSQYEALQTLKGSWSGEAIYNSKWNIIHLGFFQNALNDK